MKTNYVLVDFENVQPKSLAVLNGHPFKVLLFVGANQTKISMELAADMQALGSEAEYVRIDGNGRNALDFHIAFYAGQIAERDPDCFLHIISKDTGFDPLMRHLKARGIVANRRKSLADIPLVKAAEVKTTNARLEAVVQNLTARGTSRPRKVKTLAGTIKSLFMGSLTEPEIEKLIEELDKKGYITIDQQNINYHPPISQG